MNPNPSSKTNLNL